jgi:N-succinyldiaminopimelate aminotransferase
MNPKIHLLRDYPFEKLQRLLSGITPQEPLIDLSIGEPKLPTPPIIGQAMTEHLARLAVYPQTKGELQLREAMAQWLSQRYGLIRIDPQTEVLPINGSREGLFGIAQVLVHPDRPYVLIPNPFYQIYEGAVHMAGGIPYYLNRRRESHYALDWHRIPDAIWQKSSFCYICSPDNPTGQVMSDQDWQALIMQCQRFGVVIVADECYSEIYPTQAPTGLLEAASKMGLDDFANMIVFNSLSKRSNCPGLRSGLCAGDRSILKEYYRYRTYQGGAMSPVIQKASIAAWQDETHVQDNRAHYRTVFSEVAKFSHLASAIPQGGFYLWLPTPIVDTEFTIKAYEKGIKLLPGSFLATEHQGINPGSYHVRVSLTAPLAACALALPILDALLALPTDER